MISLMNCETMRPRKKFEKKKKLVLFVLCVFLWILIIFVLYLDLYFGKKMEIVLYQFFFLEIVDIDMRKKKREDDEKWEKLSVNGPLLNTIDMQSNG